MKDEALIEMIDEFIARVGEHVDAVQVMVTRGAEGGGTIDLMRGGGNWFARQGMAHTFINRDVAQDVGIEIGNVIGSEGWNE